MHRLLFESALQLHVCGLLIVTLNSLLSSSFTLNTVGPVRATRKKVVDDRKNLMDDVQNFMDDSLNSVDEV